MLYNVVRRVLIVLIRAVLWLCGGLRVEGAERVPAGGAVIITPNHLSFADPPVVGAVIGRPAWFMATDELFEMGLLGRFSRFLRAFPVRQDSPDRTALRNTIGLLRRGEAVVIFPEGHVSRNGAMQPVQPGTILLATQSGAPIVPVGIVGTDRMMAPHQWRIRRARTPVVVRFGQPISVEALTGGRKGRAGIDHGVRVLTEAIAALAEQTPAYAALADSGRGRCDGDGPQAAAASTAPARDEAGRNVAGTLADGADCRV